MGKPPDQYTLTARVSDDDYDELIDIEMRSATEKYTIASVEDRFVPLFLAAPEMLAALEAITAHDKNGRFGKPDFDAAIRQCLAAIAKAKGESA